jgi:hypothetical protein
MNSVTPGEMEPPMSYSRVSNSWKSWLFSLQHHEEICAVITASLPRVRSGEARWFATARPPAVDRSAEKPQPRNKANSHSLEASVPISEFTESDPPDLRERRLTWAELMLRVFQEDVLKCSKCGGRAAVISAITQPVVVAAILGCLEFSVRAPPTAQARQMHLEL